MQERLECVDEDVVHGARPAASHLDRADQQTVGGLDIALLGEEQVPSRGCGLERFGGLRVGPLRRLEQSGNVAPLASHAPDVGRPGETAAPVGVTGAQLGRPYQGGNRTGGIAALQRALRCCFEQAGYLLVGPDARLGEVPCAALGVLALPVRQCEVRLAPLVPCGEGHDPRSSEWVPEHHTTSVLVDGDESRSFRGGEIQQLGVSGSGAQDVELSGAVQHREQQQGSGGRREVGDPRCEQGLQAVGEREDVGQRVPNVPVPSAQRTRQLQQGERVALRLGEQAGAHAGRQGREPREQQLARRRVIQWPQLDGRYVPTVEEALESRSRRGQEADPASRKPAGHETQYLAAGTIDPLNVVQSPTGVGVRPLQSGAS